MEKISLKVKVYKTFSDFYTWITFNEKTELGNCSICFCDLYYKTLEASESCEHTPPKWKSVYLPNSAQNKKWNNKYGQE